MNLYEITKELQSLIDLLEHHELESEECDEYSDDLMESISFVNDNFENKVSNYAKIITHLGNKSDAVNNEIKRLSAIKSRINRNVDNLKSTLKNSMESVGIDKVDFDTFKVVLRNNPYSVNILSENDIPDEYKKQEIVVKIDKTKIKNDAKSGKDIPGSELVRNKSVRII
jgi:polyhydroxyalkanoate synthesis regulator phasin